MKVTGNPTPNTLSLDKTLGTERAADKHVGEARAAESEAVEAKAGARGGAQVEISDNARLMQTAASLANSAPDIRPDRVARLKSAIADGSYHVDSGAIADRLIEEHLGTHFGKNSL